MEEYLDRVRTSLKTYKENNPHIVIDSDYLIMKITEEWGECTQAYLMKTKRSRDKGFSEKELRTKFEDEFADVLAFLLTLAIEENINIDEVTNRKWY